MNTNRPVFVPAAQRHRRATAIPLEEREASCGTQCQRNNLQYRSARPNEEGVGAGMGRGCIFISQFILSFIYLSFSLSVRIHGCLCARMCKEKKRDKEKTRKEMLTDMEIKNERIENKMKL